MMMLGWHGMMEPGSGTLMTLGSVGLMNKYFCWLTFRLFHLEAAYIPVRKQRFDKLGIINTRNSSIFVQKTISIKIQFDHFRPFSLQN
ncbi:hypothetical protein HanRHA438_Chr14g0652291 [Helianthus annuus]|nr:hypothetical protein HanRHA438_Chr14g0652291 [Helianthus annuus]